jgi:membrane protease YdiL (CAAX protease family)
VYSLITDATVTIRQGSLWLLPGLFAQGGVAEETVFRGYLFGHLRRGRSFWRAAGLSTLPFVAVHLTLFVTLSWPVALAALLLSVLLSFPLARLFELGGWTIWPPALVHFVVQGTVKIVDVAGDAASAFPFVWMTATAVIPLLVFVIPPVTAAAGESGPPPAD